MMCVFMKCRLERFLIIFRKYSSRIFVSDSEFLKKTILCMSLSAFEIPYMYFSFNCHYLTD